MTADAGRLRRRRRFRVRVLLVVAVLGVVVAGAALWLRQALPRIAAADLGRLMNARVETGAFDLRRDGSVSVAGLVIRPKEHESAYDNTILRAENVYAHFSRRSLLSLAPRVTDIRVENFLLDVQLDLQTGRWNVGSLRFHGSRGGGGGLPTISLQRGKLRYCKVGSQVQSTAGGVPVAGAAQEVVMSVPIEARFGRKAQAYPAYSFEIQTSKLSGGYGDSNLVGEWTLPVAGQAGRLTVAGGLSSTDIPSLERAWAVDVLAADLTYSRDGAYTLKLRMKDVHGKQSPEVDMLRFITPAMVGESGPLRKLQEFFAEYQPTGTVGSIAIDARGNIRNWQESEIEGNLVCKDISVCDSDFPYQIDHLSGELEFTQSSLHANRLVGKHGNVDVCMDGWERGTGANRQYQYQFVSRNMVLDKALYAALNPEQKELWDTFRPTGVVSVDYRLTRTAPTDRRLYLSVDLNDVNAALRGFPYPLAGLTGNLFFDHESITISDVVSKTGGRQIQVNGKVTDRSGGKPGYYMSIDAKNIPLDATLRDALPVRHRELFSQCGLGGLADMRARVFSTSAAGAPGGPVGANDYSPVRPRAGGDASGVGDPNAAGDVSFLAEVVCREGTLRLPSAAREAAGQTAGAGTPPRSAGSGPADERALVVSNITAEATITPESLSIRKLNGQYGRSPVAMTGSVRFGKDEALRQCHMKLTAEQVLLDEATIGLLPPSLARQVAAFRPAGDVNVMVDLEKVDGDERPEYAVVVDCLGDRIHHERFDYPLQDIRGTISFRKDSIVLKGITARPQDGPVADFGLEGTADANPQSEIMSSPAPTGGRNPQSPRPPVIRIDGSAILARGGLEKGAFTLKATDMRFTDELGRALPKTLAGPYRELSPQGLFDLGLTTLKVSKAAEDEAIVEFGGKVNLSPGAGNPSSEQKVALEDSSPSRSPGIESSPNACHLKVSGTAVELSGALEAEGSYSTKRGLSKGRVRLAADRLMVKSKAVTHTNVEAIYDPNAQKWVAQDFVGDCYGGRLLGSLEIGPTSPRAEGPREETRGLPASSGLEYVLQVAFNDVDLQQFLLAGRSEDGGQKTEDRVQRTDGRTAPRNPSSVVRPPSSVSSSASSGTMDVWLSLNARIGDDTSSGTPGEGTSTRSPDGPRRAAPGAGRRGVCLVDIANMQVGKVSALGNVLSVLRFSEPTDYTFERMSIESYIRADKLLIPKLDLSGRSVAFTGSGTMDLPTEEINLMLTARGARVAAAEPSVLQSLTEGLSGAVVRMEVTGKASSPRVQTKALPVIEDSLRILGTPGEGKKGGKGKG
jgi:hypothetical protein